MCKSQSLFFIFTLWFCQSIAQNQHYNFWTRVSFTEPISTKWKAELEFQYRRQNDYSSNRSNLFQQSLLSSVRMWAHYQLNENNTITLSPFAYFWHNPIILTEEDKVKSQTKEIRFSTDVDLKNKLSDKLYFLNRSSIEFRDFQQSQAFSFRFRERIGLRYDFNPKFSGSIFDEVFLNLTSIGTSNFFDHNRLGILMNYKPNQTIRFEIGYIYINRLPKFATELINEHNFITHVYITLPTLNNYLHNKSNS